MEAFLRLFMLKKIQSGFFLLLVFCFLILLPRTFKSILYDRSDSASADNLKKNTSLKLTYQELLSTHQGEQREALEKACRLFSLQDSEKEALLFSLQDSEKEALLFSSIGTGNTKTHSYIFEYKSHSLVLHLLDLNKTMEARENEIKAQSKGYRGRNDLSEWLSRVRHKFC